MPETVTNKRTEGELREENELVNSGHEEIQ